MINNPLDKFEQSIQEAYKNFEIPYSSSEWSKVSRRVLRKRMLTSLAMWGSVAIVTVVIGVSSYVYLFKDNTSITTSLSNVPEISSSVNNLPSISTTNTEGISGIVSEFKKEVTQVTSSSERNVEPEKGTAYATARPKNAGTAEEILPAVTEPIKDFDKVEGKMKTLSIEPSTRLACAGTEVHFTAVNSPKNGSYLWNFGDGSFSNQENPNHIYKKSGTFDVSLSVTNSNDGQISTIAMRDLITINPKPEADFEWSYTNTPVGEPTAKFVNTSVNANSFIWKFTENRTSLEVSPSVIYNSKGKQSVLLEVQNSFGCKDSQIKIVQVNADFNLGAALKMSEQDVTFMPDALRKGGNSFKLTIYDGENIIFESTSKTKAWKGDLRGGRKAVAGQQFPWIVLIYGEDGNDARYYSGTLTIVP